MYSPGPTTVGDVNSRWSITDTKVIDRSSRQIERFVADAVTEALDGAAKPIEPRRWRAVINRPLSMFDRCEITVALEGGEEDPSSNVAIEVEFDASPPRLGIVMGLTTSIVGIPLGLGWRWQSVRSASAQGKKAIDALWRALDARLRVRVYR